MWIPSTGNDLKPETGLWSEVRWATGASPHLLWRHWLSCPTCGYHFEAIDESETTPGFFILLFVASSHVCTD